MVLSNRKLVSNVSFGQAVIRTKRRSIDTRISEGVYLNEQLTFIAV